MDSILKQITGQQAWEEFLAWRLRKGRFNWHGFQEADTFVCEEQFKPVSERIAGGQNLSSPEKHLVNKMGSDKKRVVYSYPPEEMRALKLIAHLLYRYDSSLQDNCYSFRRGRNAHTAIRDIVNAVGNNPVWAYKLDIHDYFNSISVPTLLPILKDVLSDDGPLYSFFEKMLSEDISRGVMAGTPTAPFLADIYLTEVDRHFSEEGVVYARYSDDIILFAPDRKALDKHIAALHGFLAKYALEPNPDKVKVYEPGQPFEFLGFKCLGRTIDLSEATKRKMKDKIRRAARSIRRWQSKNGIEPRKAMKALINTFNRKFFESDDPQTLTWSRWFFPVINSTGGLKEIDRYLQDNIRFLATGRHSKANYRTRYQELKALGYKSLVSEYYASKACRAR